MPIITPLNTTNPMSNDVGTIGFIPPDDVAMLLCKLLQVRRDEMAHTPIAAAPRDQCRLGLGH